MAVPTSAPICFLVLAVSSISIIVAVPTQRHRSNVQRQWANTMRSNFTTCMNEASGDGCGGFASCCRRNCPSSSVSSYCTMRHGKVRGNCTCDDGGGGERSRWIINGESYEIVDDHVIIRYDENGGWIIISGGRVIGGGGDRGEGEEAVRGQCGRPSVRPNTRGTRIIDDDSSLWHNFYSARTSQFRVVLGLHNQYSRDQSVQSMQIAKIIKHPGYNIAMHHTKDIAILKLKSPVNFTTAIQPICLPEDDASVGKKCFVTGWGATQGTGDNTYLLQVSVPIISSSTCNNTEHYGGRIDGTMLCAGRPGRDSCQGDSGGPMVCQRSDGTWELQGIVSWGDGCGLIRRPGIYSRVYTMKTWIEQNTT